MKTPLLSRPLAHPCPGSATFCPRALVFLAALALLALTTLATLIAPPAALAAQGPRLNVAAYAIVDAASGQILAQRDGNSSEQVASLTKIATALVIFDWLELSKQSQATLVAIPDAAFRLKTANPCGFQPGDSAPLRDLLYACLVQSDNIAAVALARHVGADIRRGFPDTKGSAEEVFVAQMNALARKLGMTRTKFLNPHGLDYDESPYSTALDMARLACRAMKNPGFTFYVSQKRRTIAITGADGQPRQVELRNTNELLGTDHIDGVKTGTSRRAGECLVLSSTLPPESVRNPDGSHSITPRRVLVVMLGSVRRFDDGLLLVRYGWQEYERWAERGRVVNKTVVVKTSR